MQRQNWLIGGKRLSMAEANSAVGKAAPSPKRESVSGTSLPSVGRWPAERSHPLRARRQVSSPAITNCGPRPDCFSKLVKAAVLSLMTAHGSFWNQSPHNSRARAIVKSSKKVYQAGTPICTPSLDGKSPRLQVWCA